MNNRTLRQIIFLVFVSLTLFSCSKEEVASSEPKTSSQVNVKYNYTSDELEVLNLINNYRASKGLNILEKIDYIATVSEGHDHYMISVGEISHNNFQDRYEALVTNLGAKTVSENVAYNYSTPQGVFKAWLASEGHRLNIEGDFTHFGISIRANAEGKKYYTNLFMKK
ncbi:MAG: CAP domain-containing protein [Bacteroidota bacterium]